MKSVIRWVVLGLVLAAGAAQAAWFTAVSSDTTPETVSAVSSDGFPGYLSSSWERLSSTLAETLNLQDKQ